MKKILVALLLALALPAPAAAKELSKLDVCGSSGCNSTSDRALLRRIGVGSDGSVPADPPGLAPFYTLVYHVRPGRGESFNGRKEIVFRTSFVPGAHLVRGTDENGYVVWTTASQVFTNAMARLTRGLEPFRTPRITRVSVGGTFVTDPASYERLITITSENTDYVEAYDWTPVDYRSTQSSPWTGVLLQFSAKKHALLRNNRWIHLDASLSKQVQLGTALTTTGGSGFPWRWIGIAAAALLASAGLGVALIRRFRPWEPKTA
ncbi:MAG TPA: hypothetical protein VF891_02510 [Gaiellaceae bacterium]